jgi:hypothetical protein
MTDGPGSVSTLILVVVRSTEEGEDELLFPEENGLAELGIEGVPEWVGDKGEGDGKKDVDRVESEGTADALAATMRVRTAEDHMNARL